MLESLNAKLKRQGRGQLTRYHAADCSLRKGEFAGWSVDEQKELTQLALRTITDASGEIRAHCWQRRSGTLDSGKSAACDIGTSGPIAGAVTAGCLDPFSSTT